MQARYRASHFAQGTTAGTMAFRNDAIAARALHRHIANLFAVGLERGEVRLLILAHEGGKRDPMAAPGQVTQHMVRFDFRA